MKIPLLKTEHFLKDTDLCKEEILSLFEFTAKLKQAQKLGRRHEFLKKMTLAMIFEKNSTRTRVSFQSGMYQLGGQAIFLNKNDIQLGRGEPVKDTARVLSRYIDGIMIRTFGHDRIEELAKYSSVPVINGLTDDYHPCQALADYFTMFERDKKLSGKKLVYIGDGNNMAHSLMLCGALLGVNVVIACPSAYQPKAEICAEARTIAKQSGSSIDVTESIENAAENADYLYTDVWASMGQEDEAEQRKIIFKDYCISAKLMQEKCPEAKVLHCLPAHRGEEISDEVMESDSSIVFDQAENRLHIQKAIMCALMAKKRK